MEKLRTLTALFKLFVFICEPIYTGGAEKKSMRMNLHCETSSKEKEKKPVVDFIFCFHNIIIPNT
jgi:hypothetical protein